MTTLLVLLAMGAGFGVGICCVMLGIEKRYPTAWKILVLEIKANKQKRADAAREKEAQP